jgi:hypothetical protein
VDLKEIPTFLANYTFIKKRFRFCSSVAASRQSKMLLLMFHRRAADETASKSKKKKRKREENVSFSTFQIIFRWTKLNSKKFQNFKVYQFSHFYFFLPFRRYRIIKMSTIYNGNLSVSRICGSSESIFPPITENNRPSMFIYLIRFAYSSPAWDGKIR